MGKRCKKAVLLLSGGLDSATVAAIAQEEGFNIYALTFSYGQIHNVEINSAGKIAEYFDLKSHLVIEIPLGEFTTSSLTGYGNIPLERSANGMASEIPSTYVPGRNLVFLSYAVSYAESIGAENIFIGVNAVDYSGYPDCRPEFIKAFQRTVDEGTKAGVSGEGRIKILVPLIDMSKKEIIEKGLSLNVDYSLTHSCYCPKGDGSPCGKCDSCMLRNKAFKEIGISDPVHERILKEKK